MLERRTYPFVDDFIAVFLLIIFVFVVHEIRSFSIKFHNPHPA